MAQGQRWGILWDDPNPAADAGVWITNPSYPLNPYVGINLYERTFQSEDTLVGVYSIPTNAGNQFVRFHIPSGKLALINESAASGRFFVHYTNILIAVQFSANFAWDGSLVNFDVARNKFGLAVETAAQSDYPQATAADRLAAFRDDVQTQGTFNAASINNTSPRLLYTNRHGDAFISYVHYRANGEIAPVRVDGVGVGEYRAQWARIEAEDYYAATDIAKEEIVGGFAVRVTTPGGWVMFPNVRGLTNCTEITLHFSSIGAPGRIEIREQGPDGSLLAECKVENDEKDDATRRVSVQFNHRPVRETLCVTFPAWTSAGLDGFTLSR
jgi:hypothetical protein